MEVMMAAKTLNVKPTSNAELSSPDKWGFNPSLRGKLFIRCNSKGVVNWDKAPVYNADELFGRENVKIINQAK